MGFSCSSHLVVGVRLERVRRQVSERKFNENTGEPYEKKTLVDGWSIRGMKDIPVDTGQYEDNEGTDDVVLCYSDYENKETFFLGIVIAMTGSSCKPLTENFVDVPCSFLEQIGNITSHLKEKFGYDGPIGMFLVTHFSY